MTLDRSNTRPTKQLANYQAPSQYLYGAAIRRRSDWQPNARPRARVIHARSKPNMLLTSRQRPTKYRNCDCNRDPFGNSYGYSTMKAATVEPTTDTIQHSISGAPLALAAHTRTDQYQQWIKNW